MLNIYFGNAPHHDEKSQRHADIHLKKIKLGVSGKMKNVVTRQIYEQGSSLSSTMQEGNYNRYFDMILEQDWGLRVRPDRMKSSYLIYNTNPESLATQVILERLKISHRTKYARPYKIEIYFIKGIAKPITTVKASFTWGQYKIICSAFSCSVRQTYFCQLTRYGLVLVAN